MNRPFRKRSVALGLAFVPLLCAWAIYSEVYLGGAEMIEASLLPVALFLLFMLTLANDGLRRLRPSLALTRPELLLVYTMQTVSLGVAGLGQLQFLAQVLGAPDHYASDENGWRDAFFRFLPRWAIPDPTVIPAYQKGNSTLFTAAHLWGWARPVFIWSGFILALLFGFLCLATILRRHWADHEKLSFPLITLPVELTREGTAQGLLRNPLFWGTVLLVSIYRSLSALPYLDPRFPAIFSFGSGAGQLVDLTNVFIEHPWNAIGYLVVSFHPLIIGITYFLPQEIAFSLWFFYLLIKFENVFCAAIGLRGARAGGTMEIPYTAEQGLGAFLAIAAFSLWAGRHHLAAVWEKATVRTSIVSDTDEVLSYRTAVFGFLMTSTLVIVFAMAMGLPLSAAVTFFGIYFAMIIAVSRLRAEAGPMLNYGPDQSPHRAIVQIPGSREWSASALTGLSFFHWFDSDYRTVAMPQQLEAMQIAATAPGLRGRWLAVCWMAASALAVFSSWGVLLWIYYHYGATSPIGDNGWRISNGQQPFEFLTQALNNRTGGQYFRLAWVFVGFGATAGLFRLRTLFFWWPFHPSGFAMAQAGYTLPWVWFPTFLGWAAKGLLLRYGGMQLYRRAVPVFLGLILGDALMICCWSLIGLILDTPMYMFFPG